MCFFFGCRWMVIVLVPEGLVRQGRVRVRVSPHKHSYVCIYICILLSARKSWENRGERLLCRDDIHIIPNSLVFCYFCYRRLLSWARLHVREVFFVFGSGGVPSVGSLGASASHGEAVRLRCWVGHVGRRKPFVLVEYMLGSQASTPSPASVAFRARTLLTYEERERLLLSSTLGLCPHLYIRLPTNIR